MTRFAITFFILILITYVFVQFTKNKETKIISPIPYSPAPTPQPDARIKLLEAFFYRYNSKLVLYAETFIRTADAEDLDWKLLPVVACVESSCGKFYRQNAFGWGSDKIDYGTDAQDIAGVASRIASLSYYKTYNKTKDIYDFARAYNAPFAEDYYRKLTYFYRKI